MATAPIHTDDLLDPISADQPAGVDLRWTAEYDRIKEARRSDDGLQAGQWAKRETKTADWRAVQELSASLLRNRSKDLQLALWLTEANIRLQGFAGLRDGFHVTRELISRYWDRGLYPPIEDGPEDRAGPFEWLNSKLIDSIAAIPLTAREDGGPDYSYIDFEDARRVGTETACRNADGDIDAKKKRDYDSALSQGRPSMEMFERALKETRRLRFEEFHSSFQEAYKEFKELEKVIDEKFGDDAAPNLANCRSGLNDIRQAMSEFLVRKRKDEPDPAPLADAPREGAGPSQASDPVVVRFPLSLSGAQSAPSASSWQEAELLVRSGEIDRGLAEMTRLAAAETTGRCRFERKLLLAEVCMTTGRERLARLILEELAEQIDKFQLEAWESSELISSVWTKLYKVYTQAGDDRASKLYERLCKLDPWQALGCTEG